MLKEYMAELQKMPLLEREEELSLWKRYAEGDKAAYTQLMTSYQPLVFKIAISFRLDENQTMELIQEGMLGLLEAAERFEYERGIAFSVFAQHRIRGRILNFMQKEYSVKGFSLDDVNSAGITWGECLVSNEITPVEAAERSLINDKVTQALKRLPAKEQQIITGMYLEDRTASYMADSINISIGHVYRLQKKGVRRIRGMLSRFIRDIKRS